jgi:hypothetical protein
MSRRHAGSDQMSFRDLRPARLARLGPSRLLQARSKFEPYRRPRKPYSGLGRRRCRKLRLGLPNIVTIGHPKVGKSVLKGRWQFRTATQSAGSRPRGCYISLCSAFCSFTKLDQLGSDWGERYFLAQAVFSVETHCLAFTVDRQ